MRRLVVIAIAASLAAFAPFLASSQERRPYRLQDRPYFVSVVQVCLWERDKPETVQCAMMPEAVFATERECQQRVEAAVRNAVQPALESGYDALARVACVRSVDA